MLKKLTLSALIGSFFVVGSANAAIDVANIVTELTSNQASITAVGGGALLLYAAASVFRYIKKAF